MTDKDPATTVHHIEGALTVLFDLKEEFAQWVEEAQDDSKHEALDNVLGHVELMEQEYKRRLDAAKSEL